MTVLGGVCTGFSPQWTAGSTSRADVNECYKNATDGDTIIVPAGNSTWEAPLLVTKSITFQGANLIGSGGVVGGTNITGSGACFQLSHTQVIRVTGINFINCTIMGIDAPIAGKWFRADHNSFHAASWTINESEGGCQTQMRHPTALWDHNYFFNYAIHTVGTNCSRSDGDYQDQLWAQAPPFGKGDGVVYVEDNTFDGDKSINWMDGNYGARLVARFNTIANGGGYLEVHSVQGDNRAVQMWEIYQNTMTGTGGFFGLAFIRGGSGFVFGNRVPSGTESMKLNNVRSNGGCAVDGTCVTSGLCDGFASRWDQNIFGDGYACRDQIGRSMDNTKWITGAPYAQDLTPAYFWDNIAGASTQYVPTLHDGGSGFSRLALHVQENRDWYTQNTSFNGTTGVGFGPIAARPGTCTAGVAYWATDEGEWNSLHAGPDGQLYKCIAPDTWELYYLPYPYPHLLQN